MKLDLGLIIIPAYSSYYGIDKTLIGQKETQESHSFSNLYNPISFVSHGIHPYEENWEP